MRGLLPGLDSPHPFGPRLPAVFVDDDFTQRFVSAFDTMLAPVFATLDCLDAYLDPSLTPDDVLAWLAGWVALELAEEWPEPRRRELVRHAVALHRWRGTGRGLVEQVRLVTGCDVQVADSGGCGWSAEPGTALPGEAAASVRVTVRVTSPTTVDERRLRAAVAAAAPAHVTTTVEVISA